MSNQKKPILTYLYTFTENLFLAQVPFTDYICLGDSRTQVIEEIRKTMATDNYTQLEIDYMSNFESELLNGQIIDENLDSVSPSVPLELEVFKLNEDKQEGHTGYLHNYIGHLNAPKKLRKALLKSLKLHLGDGEQTLARFLLNKKVENIFVDVVLSDAPKIEDFSSEKPLENAEQIIFPNHFNTGINQLKNNAWEVDYFIQKIKNILAHQNENVILCGPVGSGKSSIIYQAIKEALVSEKQNARYYRMHARGIKGKAKYIG